MYELRIVRERRPAYGPAPALRTSREVYEAFKSHFEDRPHEEFLVVPLDAKHRVLGFSVVSVGSLTATIVHPAMVYRVAILANAASVICMHGHPSGEPSPSQEDVEITRRLREAGDILGVRLLDHIVFGDEQYFSFVDSGYF